MGRPREHDDETAAALLASAERIVAAEGVDALSVRRVADDAGTTTRAVYSLFGSKDGLLVALGAHGFELLERAVRAQRRTEDPVADLAAVGLAFRRWAIGHPALFRISVQRWLPDPELARRYRDAGRRAFACLEERVERVQAAGRLRPGMRVQDVAVQYHALTEGLATIELRGLLGARGREGQLWRDALGALVAGLTTG